MRPRHFEITYRLNDSRRLFVQPDSHMSDDDAWFYACLHADIGVWHEDACAEGDGAQLREFAQKAGLTEVRWEELP
ncbi:hypothetical protein QIW53_17755 [Pseudomonas fluorescens]|uniref:DUF6555 family protein n=1 Tax=Pseudomonas fluorescens TaxID=294 RepID=UPI003524C09A